jgi:hypothetical protein
LASKEKVGMSSQHSNIDLFLIYLVLTSSLDSKMHRIFKTNLNNVSITSCDEVSYIEFFSANSEEEPLIALMESSNPEIEVGVLLNLVIPSPGLCRVKKHLTFRKRIHFL